MEEVTSASGSLEIVARAVALNITFNLNSYPLFNDSYWNCNPLYYYFVFQIVAVIFQMVSV
jgi:hypothetical protein